MIMPLPVAARSKAWICGRSLVGIVGSNPTGGMDVCCECCVLSGRGLCVGLITRLEESLNSERESSILGPPGPLTDGCVLENKFFYL